MARVKKKHSYHRWTDDEKQQIIRDVKQALKEGLTQSGYLQGRGISDSWFRRMQRTMVSSKVARGPSGWPLDPEERSREMQRRRAKWAKSRPAHEPVVAAALAEYKGLRHYQKVEWREARNLSSSQMSAIRHGKATPVIVARLLNNSNGNKPMRTEVSVRDQRLTRLIDTIPVMNMVPNSAPPVPSAPVTIDDAINSFRIYQDHLKEFIDRLIGIRGGR